MTERTQHRFTLDRLWTIALSTFAAAVRQKVFSLLLVFALVVMASALFFRQFSFGEQFKFVNDFCLGAISVFGTILAIVGTAQLLPEEMAHRTIQTILAKPVHRSEFLLGKFAGNGLVIVLSIAVMAAMFATVLAVLMLLAPAAAATETAPLELLKAVLLIAVKLELLAALTLLVSTVSTSMTFTVAVSFLSFFTGHLLGPAKELWSRLPIAYWLLALLPDLNTFNVADDVILGNIVPWSHVASAALYGLGYSTGILAAAHFIFANREL